MDPTQTLLDAVNAFMAGDEAMARQNLGYLEDWLGRGNSPPDWVKAVNRLDELAASNEQVAATVKFHKMFRRMWQHGTPSLGRVSAKDP